MAKLKPSEFRLLLLFAVLVFVTLNVFGFTFLNDRRKEVLVQKKALTARIEEGKGLERQEQEAINKEAWLNSRVPVYASVDQMKTFLIQFVEQRAASFQLALDLQPEEPEVRDGYMRSMLQVKLSGAIEPVCEFLFSLQDPEQFRAITAFDLQAKAKDPKTVFAEFTIEQWWNPASLSLVENAQAEPMAMPLSPAPAGVLPPGGPNSALPKPLQGSGIPGLPNIQAPGNTAPAAVQGENPAAPAPPAAGLDPKIPVLNEIANEENP